MRDAILLRYALIPYIYTASREAYDTGVSICRPMYYDYPEQDEAYDFKDEYMFGDDLIVAPIAEPVDSVSMLAKRNVWLPPGEWYEWFTGAQLKGPGIFARTFALDEIPVYARAGAVVPMQPKMKNSHEKRVSPLIFTVFPGDSGKGRVYEDDGNSDDYRHDPGNVTTVTLSSSGDRTEKTLEIIPELSRAGSAIPAGGQPMRSYEADFPGTWPPEGVTVNDKPLTYSENHGAGSWWYDGAHLMTVIATDSFPPTAPVRIRIKTARALIERGALLNGVPGTIARLRTSMPLMNASWPKDWTPDPWVRAAQTGNRISLHPGTGALELGQFHDLIRQAMYAVDSLHCDRSIIRRVHEHCEGIDK